MSEKELESEEIVEEVAEEGVGGGEASEEIPGGVQTTDPSFADGAQEVEQYSNQPK